MLATLGSVKPFFRLKPKFISIDNFAFKLHYRWSFGIFLVCTVLVTSRQYIGEHINCINDAIPNHVINTFCFFTTTFTVVRHMNDSSLAVGDASYPGVGPNHYQEDPVKHHAYYQWVPFVLLLQALLFYMPHLIWKSLEGGRIRYLVDGLHMIGASKQARVKEGIQSSGRTILTADELDGRIKRIKTTYLNRLYLNKFWGIYLVGCEFLNLMVITMQWSFTNWFLAGQFNSLGGRILNENWLGRMDVLDVVFPKMTKCHFRKFGPSGSLQLHDALCLMGLNIINEKIFTFMWFWFLFLWMVSLFAILWRFIVLLLHRSTTFNSILLPFICLGRLNRGDVENVFRKISFSNWIFLYHLAGNLESIIFRDVMSELSNELGNTQNEEGENFNNHQVEDNDERGNDSDENKTAFDTVDSEAKKN